MPPSIKLKVYRCVREREEEGKVGVKPPSSNLGWAEKLRYGGFAHVHPPQCRFNTVEIVKVLRGFRSGASLPYPTWF